MGENGAERSREDAQPGKWIDYEDEHGPVEQKEETASLPPLKSFGKPWPQRSSVVSSMDSTMWNTFSPSGTLDW